MKLYEKNASSERRIRYGIDLMHRLAQFPETLVLSEEFSASHARLAESFEARQALEITELKRRSEVAVRELHVDRQLRQFAHIVRATGNGGQSLLFRALFPEGLTEVVRPKGTAQLDPLIGLVLRLREHAAAEALRREWLGPLTELQNDFAASIEALGKTQVELREAFDRERVARDEHRASVTRVDGGLLRLYAQDKSMLRFFQPLRGLPASRSRPSDQEAKGSAPALQMSRTQSQEQ